MRHIIPKIAFVSLMSFSIPAFAFDLHGTGNHLTADGGISTQFIPIVQTGSPFVVQSPPKIIGCQNNLRLTGLMTVGSLVDKQDNLAVFAGNSDIVFTLHWKADEQNWHGITPVSVIPCQVGQPLTFKATFYRQNSFDTSTTLTRMVNQAFALKDSNTDFPIHLNATLNFAKPQKTYSCKIRSAPQQTIHLGSVPVQALERQGRIVNGSLANFTLDCNDAKTTVLAIVYDNLDSSNFGADKTILSIKAGGAKGVGVELYKDGQALALGQKPINYEPHNNTYWQIQGGEQRQLTLGAGYVKTGKVGAGKVEAQAGLVLFYP